MAAGPSGTAMHVASMLWRGGAADNPARQITHLAAVPPRPPPPGLRAGRRLPRPGGQAALRHPCRPRGLGPASMPGPSPSHTPVNSTPTRQPNEGLLALRRRSPASCRPVAPKCGGHRARRPQTRAQRCPNGTRQRRHGTPQHRDGPYQCTPGTAIRISPKTEPKSFIRRRATKIGRRPQIRLLRLPHPRR